MADTQSIPSANEMFSKISAYFSSLSGLEMTAWIMVTVGVLLLIAGAFLW